MSNAKEVFERLYANQETYVRDTLTMLYPKADIEVINKIVSDIKQLFSAIFHVDDMIDFDVASNALFQQLHHSCTALVDEEEGMALELVTNAVDSLVEDVVERLSTEL